jgi:hypothetical protein
LIRPSLRDRPAAQNQIAAPMEVFMPVYRLFRHVPFDPEHVDLMSSVFEQVSLELGLGDREDAIRDLVAQAVLECAQRGIRHPEEMRRCTHEALEAA